MKTMDIIWGTAAMMLLFTLTEMGASAQNAQDVQNVQNAQDIQEIHTVQNVPDVETVQGVPAVQNVQGTLKVQDMRNSQNVQSNQDVQTVLRNIDLTVSWQVNAPINTGFADRISGWGMNVELTYNITPRWELGAFASFHSNNGYVGRETLDISPTERFTTDQIRSMYQVPFGLTASYAFFRNNILRPYIGAKIGAMYNRNTTYFGASGLQDTAWGFYCSPEIGLEVYPFRHSGIGFQIAAYYGYGTNETHTLTEIVKGQNNLGFRVGIVF